MENIKETICIGKNGMLQFVLNPTIVKKSFLLVCSYLFLMPMCLGADQMKSTALVARFPNIHDDDIHGICFVDERHVISGSKDTSVKLVELDISASKIVGVHTLSRSPKQSYHHWVTGLDTFEDASVIAGHRNSYLLCKDVFSSTEYARGFLIPSESSEAKHGPYKQRNEHRITGIKSLKPDAYSDHSALIGMPEEFYHYDFDKKKVLGSYKFSNPEWVYGFSQISMDLVAIIHGAFLSLFRFSVADGISHWKLIDTVVSEERVSKGEQRQFISSVFSMEKVIPCSRLALSLFGGATRIIDVETKKVIHGAKEHKGRVWQTVPFSQNEYISCSDDSTIKIWDLRAGAKSMHTYDGHPGRVSSVAVMRENPLCFIAGTCPDDPHQDMYKGQFYLYDIRKSSSSVTTKSSRVTESSASSTGEIGTALDFAQAVKKLSLKEASS